MFNRPRNIASAIHNAAKKMRQKHPDNKLYSSAGPDEDFPGLIKVTRSDWPEGVTISIPSGGRYPGQVGAGVDVIAGHEKGRRGMPFLRGLVGGARGATSGSTPPPLAFGLWMQSEGFPTLPGGALLPSTMPEVGASALFNPGLPSGYQDRIGWSGMALASSGENRYLLYLSTIYNDDAEEDPSADAIGLTINEWDLLAGTLTEYTIAFDSPFDSDEGGSPGGNWFEHRLGSFFYSPEDGLITIATPYGIYCMGRVQDSQVLTPWTIDAARVSHDLSFSCAWFHALQHGWAEQEGATDGPDLLGWVRERSSKDWMQTWSRSLASLCGTMTPGRIFQSGQTDRYSGYHQSNRRMTYDAVNRRWLVGVTLAEDADWLGTGGGLSGRAGIVISSLAGATGTIANTYTIEASTSDALEVRTDMLTESLAAANSIQAGRLNDQKALVTSNDDSPKTQTGDWGPGGPGWPTKLVSVTGYPGANPAATYSFPALYNVTLSGSSVPSEISGGVVPAPAFEAGSLFPLFSPTQGQVRLRKGDDGNFWTVVFRNRQIIRGYSYNYEAEIDTPYGSFTGESLTYEVLSSSADRVGDGYEPPGPDIQSQTLILSRQVPMTADVDHEVYETLLLCLSPTLTEVSRTDLSLKFLGLYSDSIAGAQTIPVASWRNVWDWAVRGRVIWVLRDCYRSDTEEAALANPSEYKPYLEAWSLETLERLHRIEVYTDDSNSPSGTTPRLITGIQAAGDLEWAEAICVAGDATTRILRVQMQAGLTDTPDTYRDTRSGDDCPADSDEWDHQVIYNGHTYWPSNFGAIFKST